MTRSSGLFAGIAAGALLLIAAGSASSATVIKPIEGGPFSDENALGTIDAISLNVHNTYDFTFTLVDPLAGSTTEQLEAAAVKSGAPVATEFQLYAGTPTAKGALLGSSTLGLSSTLNLLLPAGNYFVQMVNNATYTDIQSNGETGSGSLTTIAVPEPATWAVMFLGFGAIGASMRNARRRRVAATA